MKKTISTLFIVYLFTACMGATAKSKPVTKTLNRYTNSYKAAINNTGTMPVIAWIGVPQYNSTIAAYKEMRAAGITQSYFPFTDVNALDKALSLAQQTGIKLFVSCPELISTPEVIVKRFMNNPAIAGYFIRDEPGAESFADLTALIKRITALDSRHICYVNLLPNYAGLKGLQAESYEQYVSRFLQTVPAKVLSFDHYPIIGSSNTAIREGWYQNLEIVAKAAREHNIPFWGFALSTSFSPYPVPTLAMLRLQVYSNLAYGAQAIQYFTYLTLSDPNVANFNNGPITNDGKSKTPVYAVMQQMNNELHMVSSIFYGCSVVSVNHTGAIPSGAKHLVALPSSIPKLTTTGLGALVSVIKNKNKSYLVVVNKDFTAKMGLSIQCAKGVLQVLKSGRSVAMPQVAKTMQIEPGDIAIFKL